MISTSITVCTTRPRSTHTSLDDLAQVEIRSIMHFLTETELIQFSRSSKQLLVDGSSIEAFKFITLKMIVTIGQSPSFATTSATTQLTDQRIEDLTLSYASSTIPRTGVTVSTDLTPPLHHPHSSQSQPSSVCSHVGLRRFIQSCHLTLNLPTQHPPLTIEWLDSILLRLPCITAFHFAFHRTPRNQGYARAEVWRLVLSHPAFNDLEEFYCDLIQWNQTIGQWASYFYLDATEECLQPLQHMTRLRTLQLPNFYVISPLLSQLESLTQICSIVYHEQMDHSVRPIYRPLSFILLTATKLKHLTGLDVSRPLWYGEQISALVTPLTGSVQSNRNIRELTLRRFYLSNLENPDMTFPTSIDFDAFFGFMTGLVKLTIDSSDARGLLMTSSICAPQLTKLILKGYPINEPPDVILLTDLFDQRPSLHITLHIALASLQEYDTNQAAIRSHEIDHGLERGWANRGRGGGGRGRRGRGRPKTIVTDEGSSGRLSARTIIVDTYALLIEHYPSFHRLDPDERN